MASGTAGGILSRLMNGGYDYIIEITQCENTGAIHSDGTGRLGGVLGGCTAGYVFGLEEKAACYIRSCVNSGVLSYGDATVNVADYTAGETDDGRALNATEKAVIIMGGSAVGGMVGASFGTVVESCLNRGLVMLPAGVPISDIEANVRLTDEDSVAFVGGISLQLVCGIVRFDLKKVRHESILDTIRRVRAILSHTEVTSPEPEASTDMATEVKR